MSILSYFGFVKRTRDERLVNNVKSHSSEYVINDNGTVSVDLSNPEAIKKIQDELKKFQGFVSSSR